MTDIFELSANAVDELCHADPLLSTYSGVVGNDDRWPDLSPEGAEESAARHRRLREAALEANGASASERLAQRVVVDYCDDHLRSFDAGLHLLDLNSIASPHQLVRHVFDVQSADDDAGWDAIVRRLETIDEVVHGYRRALEAGRIAGTTVSRRQVDAAIEQGRMAAGERSSFDALRARLTDAPVDAGDRLDRAIAGAKETYARLSDYLEQQYRPSAAETDGVGEERYAAAARTFLGTDIDLLETYRWGWDEVERLWSELQRVCARIDPDMSVAETFETLQTDPGRAATSPEEFIAVMQQRQEIALSSLDGVHFDVPPEIRAIDVRIEPAGGALAAHYGPPSEDFQRPGTVWYPIEGQTFFPLFREITIAYHEGFPGHHLQVGVQATRRDELSRFHRMLVWYPGSGEGWALYAEQLMGELGYLEKPDYEAGLLSSQLLRACRIAIDIGVHLDLPIPDDVTFHPGEAWTFELAVELLTSRALERTDAAHSEVTRYFGWPAQAISYKIGERAILDLRAEKRRAPDFDARAFHADVLACGSVGLDLLREQLSG